MELDCSRHRLMLEFLGIPLMPNRCESLPRQNGFPQRHDPIRFAEAHDIFNFDLWLRIPTHPVGCSDNIRSVIPEYPVT